MRTKKQMRGLCVGGKIVNFWFVSKRRSFDLGTLAWVKKKLDK